MRTEHGLENYSRQHRCAHNASRNDQGALARPAVDISIAARIAGGCKVPTVQLRATLPYHASSAMPLYRDLPSPNGISLPTGPLHALLRVPRVSLLLLCIVTSGCTRASGLTAQHPLPHADSRKCSVHNLGHSDVRALLLRPRLAAQPRAAMQSSTLATKSSHCCAAMWHTCTGSYHPMKRQLCNGRVMHSTRRRLAQAIARQRGTLAAVQLT